ncbi:MAG: DNA-processing protein DprA [Paracoccaceae bacterium]|nr:DNA-processing protein DprA [Paracoccaceae bacterium]
MTEDQYSSTHPPLPPTTEETRFQWLRLLRSRRVGISTFRRLLAEHGSASAALTALPDVAKSAGVQDYSICPEGVIVAELKAGAAAGAVLLAQSDPDYPQALLDLSDGPPLLWVMGRQDLLYQPTVAIVGARNSSSLGSRMAKGLATELGADGYVVVSGLARGVDTAAHNGALQTRTIAVMAGGVDCIYRSENTEFARKIAQNGVRVSEQPIGAQPQARHFPSRNRIISGLAQTVVVVEAAAKSGSLITARNALDQGRDVCAVPGHPFDARASGCNMLIRDGATLARSGADVLETIRPAPTPQLELPPQSELRSLSETAALHSEILNRLGPSPLAEDQLIRDLKSAAAIVTPALIDLELEGKVTRQSGGLIALSVQ